MSHEDDIRARLELLRQRLSDGKIKFAGHLVEGARASLAAVRYGPDGKIDLSTVDGRVRALSAAVAGVEHRAESKEAASLRDIQQSYFAYVENHFGTLYKDMLEAGAHPQSWSWAMSRHQETVDQIYPAIEPFMETLSAFWEAVEEGVRYHLQDLKFTKGVFGGDLFPSYSNNIASTCGLYLDTIILTDPFMNSKPLFPRWDRAVAVRFFVKHGLSVLSYKELALAELNPPIVAVVPFLSSVDEDERELLSRMVEPDALAHAKALFGREFGDIAEFLDFAMSLDTPEKIVGVVKDPARLLFDMEWREPLPQQIEKAIEESGGVIDPSKPGLVVFNQVFGRMMQATDILHKSWQLGGTPLIEAPTSWQYLNWKLEYSADLSPSDQLPLHMVRALQHAGSTDVEWLGAIPPEALIEMREQGAMEEIRDVLTAGVEEVAVAQPGNFFRISDHIVSNIDNAFETHRRAISELRRKKLRFWGHDIGSWLVTGSIGVAAAVTGNPVFGVAALAADQVLDAPKLRDIPKRFQHVRNETAARRRSPLALLFKHMK
jgi:hypothetical protein